MQANFNKAADFVLLKEGGFANRPLREDPGGPTKYGITMKTLAGWRKRKVTVDSVYNLSWGEAQDIYKKNYWDPIKGDKLPRGLDYVIFDCSIHSYHVRAIKILQKILNIKADGIIGHKTLDKIDDYVQNHGVDHLVDLYLKARLKFLRTLKNWEYNKNGWKNRIDYIQDHYKEFK